MNYTLDPAVLASIAEEARQCFLEEDAPVYLEALQQGLQQLSSGDSPDYKALMRAAHSVKGGAGVAQMPGLSTLAHKLEDLLEAWNDERILDTDSALVLLQQGLYSLTDLLEAARAQGLGGSTQFADPLEPDADLLSALDEFQDALDLHPEVEEMPTSAPSSGKHKLIAKALESDLENCLTHLETQLEEDEKGLEDAIAIFLDECLLLGEAYSLPWIVDTVEAALVELDKKPKGQALVKLARHNINILRSQRTEYLKDAQPAPEPAPKPSQPPVPSPSPQPAASGRQQQLRIPLERLDRMGSLVGELIVSHERLTLQQRQLKQASQTLRRIVEQVKPVRDDVQTLYDRLSTSENEENGSDNGNSSSDGGEFDVLEMDRYTALHSSLQTFEELIAQVQETRVDIDIVSRELAQDLGNVRRDLDRLYDEVTTARLVPFKTFAQRFVPQLQRINQRVGKQSALEISGENVLVDKVLLEQLQTPLTHLFNNALDHGIESPDERRLLDKPETARLYLGARTEGSEVVITVADDGRGIDLASVYRKAVERGLCPPHVAMNQLPRETLLDFIFQPSFSTAERVSDISGRGVGMDVVRTQVRQLRGSVEVDTVPGKGTTFSIRLPLSVSLLSVLLCQIGQQLVAIPSDTVLDVLPYEDAVGVGRWLGTGSQQNGRGTSVGRLEAGMPSESSLTWRGQVLPLYPLWEMLPYASRLALSQAPRVVLVLKGTSEPLAVAIDAITDERQLILKPFDDTVAIPPYIAGCAILGTGEAVPTILPRFLKPISAQRITSAPPVVAETARTILVAEDSTGARRSLERILSSAGFVVVPCRDGQEAWKKLEQRGGTVDLVVTDIEMPVLNGFDLLGRVRSHSTWYTLPVVVLTSRTGDRHRQKAKSLGANAYLGKPVTPVELLSSIDNLLKNTNKPETAADFS